MRGRQFCATLLAAVYFSILECKPQLFSARKYNMAKFLQAKVPIWTFYTTVGGKAECEVEVVQLISKKSVAFMRYFYDGTTKVASPQLGTFDQRNKDRMIVRTPGQARMYDLLVWNSSITTGPDDKCIMQYRKREAKGRMVYRPQCQDILKKRGDFQKPSVIAKTCPR
uniref:Putative group i salivary lipocalin n=1 Tax=Rhipicephalus pulchellus TaxID=72859 RepID=L7LTB7_RHIPC